MTRICQRDRGFAILLLRRKSTVRRVKSMSLILFLINRAELWLDLTNCTSGIYLKQPEYVVYMFIVLVINNSMIC